MEQEGKFRAFQRNFLVVQLLATFVDFIQGPYLYKVYQSYGFGMVRTHTCWVAAGGATISHWLTQACLLSWPSVPMLQSEIAFLYLIGFGSAALTSPFVGLFADKYGRRLGCMAFTVIQAVSGKPGLACSGCLPTMPAHCAFWY